jgi:hypothetical protein
LNLGGVVQLTDAHLGDILPAAQDLKFLSLHDVRLLTDATIALVSQHAPGLLSLDLTGCVNVSSAAVVQLLEASHGRLRHLYLRGTRACTGATLRALARCAPQLVELDASSDDVVMGSSDITDMDVAKLVATCGGLQVLKLQGQVALEDAKFSNALPLLSQLTELDITGCDSLGNLTVASAAHFCAGLRVFRASGTLLSDQGVGLLACCRRLRVLDVASCPALSLKAALSPLKRCTHLHHVLAGGLKADSCEKTGSALAALLGRPVQLGHPNSIYTGRTQARSDGDSNNIFVEFV